MNSNTGGGVSRDRRIKRGLPPKHAVPPLRTPLAGAADQVVLASVVEADSLKPISGASYDIQDEHGKATAQGKTSWQGTVQADVAAAGAYRVRVLSVPAEAAAAKREGGEPLAEASVRSKPRGVRDASPAVIPVPAGPSLLRIVLEDAGGAAIAGARLELRVGGSALRPTTEASGRFEQEVAGSKEGVLVVRELEVAIRIEKLEPAETEAGARARLANLGYAAPLTGKRDAERLRAAVEEFQCDAGLAVTGALDAPTRARLVEAHGG
ncbi:MAG TPA: peptidoglycan-binding domain-containing protein [Planctomycetota bacterium]|nr:peptidoglycan-binding domain-containing protein [Planctomycetota bacterium]